MGFIAVPSRFPDIGRFTTSDTQMNSIIQRTVGQLEGSREHAMHIVVRVLVGSGLFLLGYYLGREVSRSEFIRADLQKKRADAPANAGD